MCRTLPQQKLHSVGSHSPGRRSTYFWCSLQSHSFRNQRQRETPEPMTRSGANDPSSVWSGQSRRCLTFWSSGESSSPHRRQMHGWIRVPSRHTLLWCVRCHTVPSLRVLQDIRSRTREFRTCTRAACTWPPFCSYTDQESPRPPFLLGPTLAQCSGSLPKASTCRPSSVCFHPWWGFRYWATDSSSKYIHLAVAATLGLTACK